MDGPIFLISISQFWWNNLDRTINILPRIKHLGVSACMYESILCMTESVNQSSNKDKYYIFLDKKKKLKWNVTNIFRVVFQSKLR